MVTPDDAMDRAERGFVRRDPEASGTKGRRRLASPRFYVNPLTHNGARKSHVTESRLNRCVHRRRSIQLR